MKQLAKNAFFETLQTEGFSQVKGYRYMVAFEGQEVPIELDKFNVSEVFKYINKTEYLYANNAGLGTWLDTNTNIVYLDVSEGYHDLSEALKVAKKRNQLAIYDTLDNETIYL